MASSVPTRPRTDEENVTTSHTSTPVPSVEEPVLNKEIATSSKGSVRRPGDLIFAGLAKGAGALVVALIGLIAIFLIIRAVPSLGNNEENFLFFDGPWNTADTSAMHFGIWNLFWVTVVVSLLALIIAMPIALGIAIFLTQYCPKRLVAPLAYLVDLLSAVPSIVYGLFGFLVLGPVLKPIAEFLTNILGWFPLFALNANAPSFDTGRNIFTGGIILAIMILPIIAAMSREVFVQTPKGHIEAALALGATRWEVVRITVLPFGFSGYVSGAMLGLGRALGETMALYMVISASWSFGWSIFDGGSTFATAIANAAAEFNNDLQAGAYIAAGLVLFILTFLVNAAARAIVGRKKG